MAPRLKYVISRAVKPFVLGEKTPTAEFGTYSHSDYVIVTAALDILKVKYSVRVDLEQHGTPISEGTSWGDGEKSDDEPGSAVFNL